MIPVVAMVSLRRNDSRTYRLWIPLLLVWLLVVPVVVVLSPLILIACLACRVNPLHVAKVSWQILVALNQTELAIDHRSAGISICVL